MILKAPESIKQKSEKILTKYNINFNDDINVDLESCLEMKQLTHYISQLRYFTDDTLSTTLNDSERPNLKYRLKRCDYVIKEELFPAWEMRDKILEQCSVELEEYKQKLDVNHPDVQVSKSTLFSSIGSDNKKENLDPYKKRDMIKKTTSDYVDYNASKKWIEQQLGVEKILKERSVSILKNQCNEFADFQAFYYQARNQEDMK
ncbi:hypothetical protein ACO0R3_001867 [Hanseniaspora guilliermondii]